MIAPLNIDALLDALADRIAARLAAGSAPVEERIPLHEVKERGAPSKRWAVAKGLARGPRGARFVLASELAAALAASTVARRSPAAPAPDRDDVSATVADLAARRARKAGAR